MQSKLCDLARGHPPERRPPVHVRDGEELQADGKVLLLLVLSLFIAAAPAVDPQHVSGRVARLLGDGHGNRDRDLRDVAGRGGAALHAPHAAADPLG